MTSFQLIGQILTFCCLAVVFVSSCNCRTVLTFNAALTRHVGNYENRRTAIPVALLTEDADVLCLQEYWNEEDVKCLLDELDSSYPYHYSAIHKRVGRLRKPESEMSWWEKLTNSVAESACSTGDLAYFNTVVLGCVAMRGCLGKFKISNNAGTACVAKECASVLRSDKLSADCISCITMMATGLTDTFNSCYRITGHHNRFNTPGLVLLSKKPMSNVLYKSYHPGRDMAIPRGYLKADVQDIGEVVCTHLTSDFPYYFEYDLDFGNYTAQLTDEVYKLNQDLGTTAHIVTGDLNMGPGADPDSVTELTDEVQWEQIQNYELLMSFGYEKSPYIEEDGRCTACVSNPLRPDNNVSKAIDDVLLMGNLYPNTNSWRVLDQSTPCVLSDHYGVKAELCP